MGTVAQLRVLNPSCVAGYREAKKQMQKPDQSALPANATNPSGIDTLTPEEVRDRIRAGWRAVRFEFCVSFLLATIRRQSGVYLTESWQERWPFVSANFRRSQSPE